MANDGLAHRLETWHHCGHRFLVATRLSSAGLFSSDEHGHLQNYLAKLAYERGYFSGQTGKLQLYVRKNSVDIPVEKVTDVSVAERGVGSGNMVAFTVETGMTTGFDNRVRASMLAAQTAIGVFEARHA